jgi:serpin B
VRACVPAQGRVRDADTVHSRCRRLHRDRRRILDVIHQGFVSVNEAGTEASAATAVIFGRDGGISFDAARPVALRLDHPFVIMIRQVETGNVLFLGRVESP